MAVQALYAILLLLLGDNMAVCSAPTLSATFSPRLPILGYRDLLLSVAAPQRLRGGVQESESGISDSDITGSDAVNHGNAEEGGATCSQDFEGDDPVRHIPADAPVGCPGTQAAEAGKTSSCEGCPNQAKCAAGKGSELDPDFASIHDRMMSVNYKVLVLSGKGGVGKSTVASQLAMLLSKSPVIQPGGGKAGGRAVAATGLLDIDICGPSAPRMLGVEACEVRQAASGWQPVWVNEGLCVMSIGFMLPSREDAVVWRGVRKNGLMKQFLKDVEWGALEYLVVDAPPGTSDEHITVAQCLNHTHNVAAIIVTTPQEMALLDVRKEINFCYKAGIPILGIVENMAGFVCPHCNRSSEIFLPSSVDVGAEAADSSRRREEVDGGEESEVRGAQAMARRFGLPFLGRVPLDARLGLASEKGLCLQDDNDSPAASALQQLALAVRYRLFDMFGPPPSPLPLAE